MVCTFSLTTYGISGGNVKVVFLDIDGVLNHSLEFERWYHRRQDDPSLVISNCIDPKCVEQLNRLLEATGAVCVLSSSWRTEHTMEWMRNHLADFGFKGDLIDKTVHLPLKERGVEIAQWVDEHRPERFVILDDNTDMWKLSPYLVKTDFNIGLTSELAGIAERMLNG